MNQMSIRVLLVEDSPVAQVILKRMLTSSPEIEVVGTARHGREALELIPSLQPQVICTDIHMPQMNGLEFTEEVMRRYPRPILVISASVQPEDTHTIFQMLQAGAVDVFPKPRAGMISDYESIKQQLITKIKVLSGVAVFTLHRKSRGMQETFPSRSISIQRNGEVKKGVEGIKEKLTIPQSPILNAKSFSATARNAIYNPKIKIITIGASTGGPQALHAILTNLPASLAVPVICVQHISEGFLQGLVDWLTSECQLPIKIASYGESPLPGTIYFPPEGCHLELNSQGRFVCSSSPPVCGHRPSVTVTFKSVAHVFGRGTVGILLTGMGRDGAEGMLAIAQAGGTTIAQDEASCVVFGMPKEAIALGAAQHVLPVGDIAPMLLKQLKMVNG